MDNTQNIISFCTGYGGIELGLRRAGVDVRTVFNVEIEAFCCANLAAKIEEGRMDDAPIYSDLKTFPARIFRGKYTGSLEDIPVSPSVARESEKERKTQDTCGLTSDSMSGQLDLFGAFSRMSEVTPRWGYGESCPIWKKMVTERSGIVLSGGNRRASPTHPMLHPGLPQLRGITRDATRLWFARTGNRGAIYCPMR